MARRKGTRRRRGGRQSRGVIGNFISMIPGIGPVIGKPIGWAEDAIVGLNKPSKKAASRSRMVGMTNHLPIIAGVRGRRSRM